MMSSPVVSVVVPSYRPGDYLWECLDSLCKQTLEKDKYEIIIILNGCKEPYETAIISYIDNYKDLIIKYFQTDEGGVSNARNIGIDIARGDFIAFIDDDDYVSEVYLEGLLSAVAPNGIAISNTYAFRNNDRKRLPYKMTDVYNKCSNKRKVNINQVSKFFSGPCMKLIPKRIINDRRFDNSFVNGEDSLFMFLISDGIEKVSFAPEEAVYYRRFRSGSAIYRKRSKMDTLHLCFRLLKTYTGYYFSNPKNYNIIFYFTRLLASIKGTLKSLL